MVGKNLSLCTGLWKCKRSVGNCALVIMSKKEKIWAYRWKLLTMFKWFYIIILIMTFSILLVDMSNYVAIELHHGGYLSNEPYYNYVGGDVGIKWNFGYHWLEGWLLHGEI